MDVANQDKKSVNRSTYALFRRYKNLFGGVMPMVNFLNGMSRPKRKIMPLPTSAQIEVTTQCNFKCITCGRVSMKNRLNLNLTPERFEHVLDQNPNVKRLTLVGYGETLMAQNLQEIIDIAKKRSIDLTTFTNGSLLHIDKYANLAIQFNVLVVSFDAAEKETFERIRVGSNFEKTKEGISKINRMRKEQGRDMSLRINFIASHLNYKEIPKLADICMETGVDEIGIGEVANFYTPGEPEYAEMASFVREGRKMHNEILASIDQLRERLKNTDKVLSYSPYRKVKPICRGPFDTFSMAADGHITPCCMRYNPEIINFGNINKTSFAEIWNGEGYQKFRESMIKGTSNPICDCCPD